MDAPSKKMMRSLLIGADGAVDEVNAREALLFLDRCASRLSVGWLRDFDNRPVCAFLKERGHFLTAQPPRLAKAGNMLPYTLP